MNIKFQAPDSTTPGFLKRMKRALSFSEQIQSGKLSASLVDDLVDFLVGFVTEPKDKNKAKEMLMDASQEQFEGMLAAVTGANANPVPLASEKP